MLRSLFSAASALRSHATAMDVIGNNIANVNTAGFKSSQAQFQDTLSQTLRAAGGGVNPMQVGLGVQVAGIATNFGQGNTQMTNRQGDLAISGDGFFITKQAGAQVYTRAGSFSVDEAGIFRTPSGATLQGWNAVDGAVNTGAAIADLRLPPGLVMAPQATAGVDVSGNLPADAAIGTSIVTGIDVYDSTGRNIPVNLTYTKTAADTWTAETTARAADGTTSAVGTTTLTWSTATQSFNTDTITVSQAALTAAGYSFPADVDITIGGDATPLTQYAGEGTVTFRTQDGVAGGDLQSYGVGADGKITGSFSNGRTQVLGQLALATFSNPEGLEKAGDSSFRVTAASGQPSIGVANGGGRGSIAAGRLEMSNVDLAQEFTNLVMVQRGFQANSRVVSAADEILQDLVNLKR